MVESWREMLYPLGFLAQFLFGWRLFSQWIASEIEQKSVTTKNFWHVSLAGNILLMLHSLIQVQFHVCLTQACNAVISWRNLNLMEGKRKKLSFVIGLQAITIILVFLFFLIQDRSFAWFRTPVVSFFNIQTSPVHYLWHILAFIGLILSSVRFWVQWWSAEREMTSQLGASFWWCSLAGTLLTLFYFVRIGDPVNFIGPILGTIPYIRNLILIKKSNREMQST